MDRLVTLPIDRWDAAPAPADQALAIEALESGRVVWMPALAFGFEPRESVLFDPALGAQAKNISLDPRRHLLRGTSADAAARELLQTMMQRYADAAGRIVQALLPRYGAGLHWGRTSFRPCEIEGRRTSWRKDDTRLHVDAFPSSPTGGRRILRVFSNVHPQDGTRRWRLGEPFEDVARRFLPAIRAPWPGSAALLHRLRVTKQPRSPYDHYMGRLHDRMKADPAYQTSCDQIVHEFPPGGTWLVYTDLASHAAMRGQYMLEQTFLVEMAVQADPARAPLRVLERMLGRALA
ncbi:MAG: Kdo hydroxylase family protein [Burkholderiales bacterium]|nr:Kdo hydroxylase family protein [Burkholderiales bacterium]MDE1928054.1 Kdo hydroxylase family protein [Burkholderiales bacterium]MDE2158774.1 Kdo hydroxylase family protein [Burkholderiales bacterium]MDE2503605.1 Kdo hydroxylase family protein [Burkholderiales bacterium]